MAVIEVVAKDSSRLDEVKQLWRNNRATLGFYPEGAFTERAQKSQILVAVESDDVVGYLLYYTSGKAGRVRLTHLCVAKACRHRGYARQLLSELRRLTSSHRGIGLYCRRDFPAWSVWPKLGFIAISEKVGRSEDGHELTYYWDEHPHKSLFSTRGDDDGLKLVIDANIFYDIDDPSRNGAEETQGILADWLQPSIQICISGELFNEIQRNENSEQRKERLSRARRFECIVSNTDEFLVANDSVRSMLGIPKSERDESDQRHLARTIASDATVFVTRDEPILKYADDIYDEHGLSVVRPSQLVARFEELRNEREYQRARLAGTPLQVRRTSTDANILAEQFQDLLSAERKRDLAEHLNRAFAHPNFFECHLVEANDSRPLALHVAEKRNGGLLTVPTFRIARNVLETRLAPTLARTLLAGIVQNALRSGYPVVRVIEPHLNPVVTNALASTGFFLAGDAWLKMSIINADTVGAVSQRLEEIATAAGIPATAVDHIVKVLSDASFAEDTTAILEMEHILWPGKFVGCNVANYVVPIRPRWASDLFDAGLAKHTLWGAETELALNPDSVYYRATRPAIRTHQGRILWYVSSDQDIPGSKQVRACSQLSDVVIGGPKELFQRFRRFGVYQWQHVLETAGSLNGHLMALQFGDTELFTDPIDWNTTQSILRNYDIRSNFQSPTEITEEAFLEIYRRGLGNNS